MANPNVFVKARFHNYLSNNDPKYDEKLEKREFSWTKNFGWYKYVTRNEACLKFDVDSDTLNHLMELKRVASEKALKKLEKESNISNKKARHLALIRYEPEYKQYLKLVNELESKSKFTGLYDKNGAVMKDDEQNVLKKFAAIKNEQIVFEQVFSLSSQFMKKNKLLTPSEFYKLIKSQMPVILKDYGFTNPKNIEWNLAFHVNTDNLHAHISFWEKTPKFIEIKKGEPNLTFKKKGEIEHNKLITAGFLIEKDYRDDKYIRENIYNLRESILKSFDEVENLKTNDLWKEIKEVFNDFQNSLSNSKYDISKLSKYLRENKIWYNSNKINSTAKAQIDMLSYEILERNIKFKNSFLALQRNLRLKQEELIEVSKPYFIDKYPKLYNTDERPPTKILSDYGIKQNQKIYSIFNFFKEQLYGKDGFFSRIGNQLIKELKKFEVDEQFEIFPDNRFAISKSKRRRKTFKKVHTSILLKSIDKVEIDAFKKYNKLQEDIQNTNQNLLKTEKRKENQ